MNLREAFNLLAISGSSSAEEIRKAYREKCSKTHPDAGGDPADFKEVQEAYDLVSRTSDSATASAWTAAIQRIAEDAYDQDIISPLQYIRGQINKEILGWDRKLRSARKALESILSEFDAIDGIPAEVVLRPFLERRRAFSEDEISRAEQNIEILRLALSKTKN